jgi:alginate O-acetyltransferase complex protein AlgJ
MSSPSPDIIPQSESPAAGSRESALVVTAVFIALLFLPGTYHVIFGLAQEDVQRWTQWLHGEEPPEAIRKIETDLDQRFVLAQVTRTLMSGVPIKPLRLDPEHDVVPGADGFRYYGVDVQVARNAGFLDPRLDRGGRAAHAIVDLSRQLSQRGIHLLVVPIPAKSSIYPERLNPKYDLARGPDLNVHHAGWISRLREGGVDVLDLTDSFWTQRYGPDGELLYPLWDSHWSARGMELGAVAIASRIRPHLAGAAPASPFKTRTRQRIQAGDLHNLDPELGDGTPPPIVPEFHRQLYDDNGPVVPGGEAPVLVIGDSYAALEVEEGGGLSQQIMAELNTPVQSAALIGAKGDSMRSILRSDPELLRNKRVVVMAFTIRLLVCCDWNPIPLPD